MKGKYTRIFNRNFLLLLAMLIAVGSTAITVYAQSATDSATGTVTVTGAAPTVSGIELVDSAYSTVTTVTPDNTLIFGINATVADTNTLADLANVSFYLYDNSIHSGDFASASPNGYDLMHIWWNESNDIWTLDQGAFTEWTIQTPQDPGTGSGLTSYEFTARFDISRAALADTDWRCSAIAYDDGGATDTDSIGSDQTMEINFEISWSASTFAWGNVAALSTNNTMTVNRTLSIYANSPWELQINGSDFTGSQPDEDLETQDMVMWSEVETEGNANSFWLRNTLATGLGNWDAQSAMASETAISREIHLWFNEGGHLVADNEYSITVWVVLQSDV
jgi:hypothetical protein